MKTQAPFIPQLIETMKSTTPEISTPTKMTQNCGCAPRFCPPTSPKLHHRARAPMQLSSSAVNQHKGPRRQKKTLFCYVQHLRTMSADNNVDAASEVTSPKKTICTSETDDTSKCLPSLRSDREHPSPGPNQKVSGSGAVCQPAGPDGPNVDVFQSGGNTADTGILALRTIRGSPAKTG
jgi:hypothetical protein